jgi:NAD(P)-dependent dehydrogenase (short-subunit alcohol dehydrogenase family)
MKYALPHLVAGGGSIVTTGSHLAWHAAPTLSAYTASKHAVIGMTKAVALEYGRDNIRANIVCPSAMTRRRARRPRRASTPMTRPSAGSCDRPVRQRPRRAAGGDRGGCMAAAGCSEHVSGIVRYGAQSAS